MEDTGHSVKRDLAMELYQFIKNGNLENKLLMKENKLSILTSHLAALNKVFVTYNSSEIMDSSRREAVEFLRNFCFKIPTLKLINDVKMVEGAIDVSRLHSLTVLEISKGPIYRMVGLRSLQSQLKVLICRRCLHSMEILLAKCGGDQSEEGDWPHLNTLNLSFNSLTTIDSSLKLLPVLTVLDLSHNQIKNTGDDLECLTELQYLNLSHNCLTRVPSLCQVAQRKLKALNLRNNSIEYLDGIHLLENLESLELSRNCIYSEETLQALNSVWQISQINFRGNPVTHERLYRESVARNLPPDTAFRTVLLDGKPLSEAEIKVIPTQRKPAYHSLYRGRAPQASDGITASDFADRSVDLFEDSGDYSSSGPSKTREKKRKKKRVRHVVISEQAQSEGLPAITPKSVESTTNMEDAKREFERKREELGSDWLLALQDPYKKPTMPAEKPESVNPFLQKRQQQPSPIPKVKPPNSDENTSQKVEKEKVEEHVEEKKERQVVVTTAEVEKRQRIAPLEGPEEVGLQEDVPDGGDEDTPLSQHDELPSMTDTLNSTGVDLEYEYPTGGIVFSSQDDAMTVREEDTASTLRRTNSEEDLCGPLLVKVAPIKGGELIEILLTVKQTHLEESDLLGEVQERLELSSLLSVEVSEREQTDDGPVPAVEIHFEYVRKDRRHRKYYMEDQSSMETLCGVLEPFWHQNQEKKVTQYMSCLKCAKEFPLSKAAMIVDKPKGRKSSDQQDALNEIPTCPFCGNRYLVDREHNGTSSGNQTPIVGSLSSVDATKPLATSSPWRNKENGKYSSSLDKHYSVSPVFQRRSLGATNQPEVQVTIVHPSSPSNYDSANIPNDDTISSEVLDEALRLPESTIPSDSVSSKTPIEEVAHYSRDQLDALLKSNKSEFQSRYSLMPQVSMDASSSQGTPSRSPSRPQSTSSQSSIIRSTDGKLGGHSENIYAGRSELSDEDEIDILDESQESTRQDFVDSNHMTMKGRESVSSRASTRVYGRHGSNESDIAVLSDRDHQDSDSVYSQKDGITSDNVFGSTEVDPTDQKMSKVTFEVGGQGGGRRPDNNNERGNGYHDSGISNSASTDDQDGKNKAGRVSILSSTKGNFVFADHRLKLFYSMSLFSSDEESFKCHTMGTICTSSMLGLVSYEGLVVSSTSHLYVLKIAKEESDKPSDFLQKKLHFTLQDLLYIHMGLGSQLLQFEFADDGGRFTLIIGDSEWGESFAKMLQDSIPPKSGGNPSKFKCIERNHKEVTEAISSLLDDEDDATSLGESVYIHGLEIKQKVSSHMRQGILITGAYIYLLMENCSWPLTGPNSVKVTPKGNHFTLKEYFSLTDVTDVECNLQDLKAAINFSDEDNEIEGQWKVKFLTVSSMKQILDVINKTWSEQFGVDLTISYVKT